MEAVISGRMGKGVALDGASVLSLDLDGTEHFVRFRPADLRMLLGEAGDTVILENTDRETILERLRLERNCAYALDLTLISRDPELSREVRTEAVQLLEELLGDERTADQVEHTLYAKPLPDDADLEGALACCGSDGVSTVQMFFERLGENQSVIRNVRRAWAALPEKVFGGSPAKAEFHDLAIREGLFRALVLSVRDSSIGSFLLTALRRESVRAMHNYSEVLQIWSDPLRDDEVTRLRTLTVAEEAGNELIGETARKKAREKDGALNAGPQEDTSPVIRIELRSYIRRLWTEIRELPFRQRLALLLSVRDSNGQDIITLLVHAYVASARQIAEVLGMSVAEFAEMWKDLPFDDATIAMRLDISRQQVVNLRRSARMRLARRMSAHAPELEAKVNEELEAPDNLPAPQSAYDEVIDKRHSDLAARNAGSRILAALGLAV